MTNIDDLPVIDIWPLIFRNLSINDLFNCRLVNKKFKYCSDHSDGIYRLIVGELYSAREWNYLWLDLYNNRKEESITFKCYQRIRSLNLFNLNKNLKYLIIKVNNDNEFNLEELSSFINLKNLKIEISNNSTFNKDKNLNLENLTFFDFKTFESNYKINLNTPKLTTIKYDNYMNPYPFQHLYHYSYFFENVRISNPESIKHLIIYNYNQKFEIFKNLEILDSFLLRSIDLDFLNCFTKLRKIKFKYYFDIFTIKNLLNRIKNQQRDIFIYYLDVKIENINKVIECEYFKNNLVYQIENYNQLDSNLSTITTGLNYNHLERSFGDSQINLPASFFDKFAHLLEIYVCENVNNVDDLNWFLQNLKNLRELYLYGGSFDQNFYDNLPNTIRKLDIRSNENIENYDFILKFTKLTEFHISKNIDLFNLVLKSFLNLKDLEQFKFYFKKKSIVITKFKGKFNLEIDSKIKKKKINYKKLKIFTDLIRFPGIINIVEFLLNRLTNNHW